MGAWHLPPPPPPSTHNEEEEDGSRIYSSLLFSPATKVFERCKFFVKSVIWKLNFGTEISYKNIAYSLNSLIPAAGV